MPIGNSCASRRSLPVFPNTRYAWATPRTAVIRKHGQRSPPSRTSFSRCEVKENVSDTSTELSTSSIVRAMMVIDYISSYDCSHFSSTVPQVGPPFEITSQPGLLRWPPIATSSSPPLWGIRQRERGVRYHSMHTGFFLPLNLLDNRLNLREFQALKTR